METPKKPLLCDVLREMSDLARATKLQLEFNDLAEVLKREADKGMLWYPICPDEVREHEILEYDYEQFLTSEGVDLLESEGLKIERRLHDNVFWTCITW
jgi:hypothetical protein